jgi:hypothetical protein
MNAYESGFSNRITKYAKSLQRTYGGPGPAGYLR